MDTRREQRGRGGALLLGIFAIALLPRAIGIGEFATVDEAVHWFDRARDFLGAFTTGNYAGTYLVGHPGVTTMWLGALGEWVYHQLGMNDQIARMHLLRLPVAVVNALVIALAYLPLRRLFGPAVALLAAMLWATDPFLVAHGQLLHVDALLSSFMTLSLLFGLVAFGWDVPVPSAQRGVNWGALITSGILAGLALLTKSPAMLLPVEVGLLALIAFVRAGAGRPGALRTMAAALALWGAIALLVFLAIWPAAWANPIGVIQRMADEVRTNGGSPHPTGNFLLGKSVADPGVLFYPLALAFRTTPWAMLGMVAALGWMRSPSAGPTGRSSLAALAGAAVLLVAILSIMAKKFDRYALPATPLIQIIAACGLSWLAQSLFRLAQQRITAAQQRWAMKASWAAAALLLGANLLRYHPYELAYYNPLLGGGTVAQRTIPVGWGEGFDLAMRYISQQPDGCTRPTVVWYRSLVEGLTCGPTLRMGDLVLGKRAGYAILYVDQEQRGYYSDATEILRSRAIPIHTVEIAGVSYAVIYRVPKPQEHMLNALFQHDLRLLSYEIDSSIPSGLVVTFNWLPEGWQSDEVMLFIHVLDESGARITQVDVPLQSDQPAEFWAPDRIESQQQQIPLPPDLDPGTYWVSVGIYQREDGQRIPFTLPTQQRVGPQSGASALTIGAFSR